MSGGRALGEGCHGGWDRSRIQISDRLEFADAVEEYSSRSYVLLDERQ